MLGGRWGALGGRWEGVGLASGEGRPGSLVYRQIKSLHCSGYLLVVHIGHYFSPKQTSTYIQCGCLFNLEQAVIRHLVDSFFCYLIVKNI